MNKNPVVPWCFLLVYISGHNLKCLVAFLGCDKTNIKNQIGMHTDRPVSGNSQI